MKKITTFILIVIIASFLGGLYGILHDQFTYSISEEYYTKFKFVQFGLENWGLGINLGTSQSPEIKLEAPRLGVSLIGFLATWWVGLIAGLFLGLLGFVHDNSLTMFWTTIKAFCITLVVAFLIGLLGLVYGQLFLLEENLNWLLPQNLLNKNRFVLVGAMHNFSYLGGILGVVIGAIYSLTQKRKLIYSN